MLTVLIILNLLISQVEEPVLTFVNEDGTRIEREDGNNYSYNAILERYGYEPLYLNPYSSFEDTLIVEPDTLCLDATNIYYDYLVIEENGQEIIVIHLKEIRDE
jgi:hypothetical protein